MVLAIITLIVSLIGYFGAKKGGASDTTAALAGIAAGAGTYYVGSQTDWGKDAVASIEDWIGLTGDDGQPVLNGNGTAAKIPEGAEVIKNEDGSVARDANGNVMWKLVDSAGNVLQSWGPTGTAAVVGAGAVASSDLIDSPWFWLGAGAVLIAVLK